MYNFGELSEKKIGYNLYLYCTFLNICNSKLTVYVTTIVSKLSFSVTEIYFWYISGISWIQRDFFRHRKIKASYKSIKKLWIYTNMLEIRIIETNSSFCFISVLFLFLNGEFFLRDNFHPRAILVIMILKGKISLPLSV